MEREPQVCSQDIYHKLGTLEGKLDSIIGRTTDFQRDIDACFSRIRVIEANLNKAIGVAILIGILAPVLATTLSTVQVDRALNGLQDSIKVN